MHMCTNFKYVNSQGVGLGLACRLGALYSGSYKKGSHYVYIPVHVFGNSYVVHSTTHF